MMMGMHVLCVMLIKHDGGLESRVISHSCVGDDDLITN